MLGISELVTELGLNGVAGTLVQIGIGYLAVKKTSEMLGKEVADK